MVSSLKWIGTWGTRTRATQASPPPLSGGGILRGDRHIRRGGSGAFRGRVFGGQIVTFVGTGEGGSGVGTLASPIGGGARRSWDQDEGDASVPTPRLIHPRPYGDEGASEAT